MHPTQPRTNAVHIAALISGILFFLAFSVLVGLQSLTFLRTGNIGSDHMVMLAFLTLGCWWVAVYLMRAVCPKLPAACTQVVTALLSLAWTLLCLWLVGLLTWSVYLAYIPFTADEYTCTVVYALASGVGVLVLFGRELLPKPEATANA